MLLKPINPLHSDNPHDFSTISTPRTMQTIKRLSKQLTIKTCLEREVDLALVTRFHASTVPFPFDSTFIVLNICHLSLTIMQLLACASLVISLPQRSVLFHLSLDLRLYFKFPQLLQSLSD